MFAACCIVHDLNIYEGVELKYGDAVNTNLFNQQVRVSKLTDIPKTSNRFSC